MHVVFPSPLVSHINSDAKHIILSSGIYPMTEYKRKKDNEE